MVTKQTSGLCTSPTELYFCPRRLHPLRPPLKNLHVILNLPCVLFHVQGNIGSLELAIAGVFTQQELATNQYLGSFPGESVVKRLPAHHYLKRPLFLSHKDTLIPLTTLSPSLSHAHMLPHAIVLFSYLKGFCLTSQMSPMSLG